MTLKRKLSLAVLILITLVVGCGLRTHYQGYPPTPSPVNGDWIGLTEWDRAYYKLILVPAGRGVLYQEYETGRIERYEIIRWSVQERSLRCEFKSERSPHKPSDLQCENRDSHLLGTLTAVGGSTIRIVFRREKVFEESLSRLRGLRLE
jgi:hypothetical protein